MSVTRHHAEWLSLIEVSGPFLSMPVLLRAFPQGLDELSTDKEVRKRLGEANDEWQEDQAAPKPDPAIHHAWVRFVLEEVLMFEGTKDNPALVDAQAIPASLRIAVPEQGETLSPDLVLINPKDDANPGKPRMLVRVLPASQDLEKPLAGQRWKASPATRMMELLHGSNLLLGLVTNGEHWMLVHAPRGETTGFASFYAHLWQEEPITFRAFRNLLGKHRFFGAPEGETLEALYKESAADQHEVTDQLGLQVRKAVELLIQAIDRIDRDRNRELLAGYDEKRLYDAAVTVMMRLVFLLSAEERGLLPLGDPIYDENYAISTLREELEEQVEKDGEEVLERRYDAWVRLLATFRAIHGGIKHDRLRLPAYGGSLFDPDRFPFLEGRKVGTKWVETPAEPLPIHNRTVLHLLNSIQLLEVKIPGRGPRETRRLSFRALDIEQVGNVYEGLLDHTAIRAETPVLGFVGSKKKEPEIPLPKLEGEKQKGEEKLIAFLKDETGRSPSALKKGLKYKLDEKDQSLLVACESTPLYNSVKPWSALIRKDEVGLPIVIKEGSVYVTRGPDRRSTGTHYTPRCLTEPIVQYTLEPLVYVGPAEGKPRDQWKLKTAKEILDLKICDMAMGSGAFLVQACRYLSERIVEAWEEAEKEHPGKFVTTPDGSLSNGVATERLIPPDPAERLAIARRAVADRCLYGVDINPMAVEMAKLSIWLITLHRDRPFTFLDHALKCGDSLLGVSTLRQIENFSLGEENPIVTPAIKAVIRQVTEATEKRRALAALLSNDHAQLLAKKRLHDEAENATAKVKALADLLIAFELRGLDAKAYDEQRTTAASQADVAMRKQLPELQAYARDQLRGRRPFHWSAEFPEVFQRGGFDTFFGNPPFIGGTRISAMFGSDFLKYAQTLWPTFRSRADYCALFFLRAYELLLLCNGCFGLIATNTIAQGDTREAGLEEILRRGGHIYEAVSSMGWPGVAGVSVSIVHVAKDTSSRRCPRLDGQHVDAISAYLESSSSNKTPNQLVANFGKSFAGSKLDGIGFVLSEEEARALIAKNHANRKVIKPYLNGADITSRPDMSPSRWVIQFLQEDEDAVRMFSDCYSILRERVYPSRQQHSEERTRKRWWMFQRVRQELYEAIRPLARVLVAAQTSKFLSLGFQPPDQVFSHMTVVFPFSGGEHFAILGSTLHELWVARYSSTLETRLRYIASDCFETFPLPLGDDIIKSIGERYHELRRQIMLVRQEGLTKTYNRFHDHSEKSEDIVQLRLLHVEMDQAVAAGYCWNDLDLGHGFHTTKQVDRYTISESARRTVLDRLLALNHERHEHEIREGLVGPDGKAEKTKGKKGKKKPKGSKGNLEMF